MTHYTHTYLHTSPLSKNYLSGAGFGLWIQPSA